MPRNGYVRIYREEINDDLIGFQKPFTSAEAWQWLKAEARWEKSTVTVQRRSGKKMIDTELGFGDLAHSQRILAKEWGWDRGKVRRFLDNLEKSGRITMESPDPQSGPVTHHQTTRISICNFDEYSGDRPTIRPSNAPPNDPSSKEVKKEKETTYTPKFSSGDWQYDLAVLHADKRRGADKVVDRFVRDAKKDDFQKWADTLDKINRIDGVEVKDIRAMILWAAEDEFWAKNSISLSSWRNKSPKNHLLKHENIANSMDRSGTKKREYDPDIPDYLRDLVV